MPTIYKIDTLSESFWIWMKEQSVAVVQAVVQPTQLEVVVTDEQCTSDFQ